MEDATSKTFHQTLTEKVQDFYEADEETVATLLQNLRQNLRDGKFRFVILMDRLEDRLRHLIAFVNQNSRFDIFGVELEFYKFHEYEIIIPKLYGAEVKKEVGVATSVRTKGNWNDVSFFEDAEKKLSPQDVERLRKIYQFSIEHAQLSWGTGALGSFSAKFSSVSAARSLYSVFSNGDLWLNFGWLGDDENAAAAAGKFGRELKRLTGFDLPEDFQQRRLIIKGEVWLHQYESFINTVRLTVVQREP